MKDTVTKTHPAVVFLTNESLWISVSALLPSAAPGGFTGFCKVVTM